MVKIIFLIVCILCVFCDTSSSNNINCNYHVNERQVLGSIYECYVNSGPNIINPDSAVISSVSGTHMSSKGNDDVIGIYANGKIFHHFPQGLEKLFKNLKMIWIQSSHLKEIHQSDLKPFPNLVFFYLPYNDIGVFEEGLFDYNPNLEVVGFDGNNVSHIDPNVFDKLDKIRYFWSGRNTCISKNVFDSKQEAKDAIKLAKAQCINSEYSSLDASFRNLESESKTLGSEAFSAKLKTFEETFKNSKFSKFQPLKNKFEALKAQHIARSVTSTTTVAPTTQKPLVCTESMPILNPSTSVCSNCCKIDEISSSIANFQTNFQAFDEKLENLDDQVTTLNGHASRNVNVIQKELETSRFKTLVSIDAKLKSIEARLMGKIEKALDDKLDEKLDQKFAKIYKALHILDIIACLIAITQVKCSELSTNLECDFGYNFFFSPYKYTCYMSSLTSYPSKIITIDDVYGDHYPATLTNNDVFGFYAENKNFKYFPQNLDKFFKNLVLIRIMNCKLKEIHQSDLKVFRNLELLQIRDNLIEILEEGLFEFNQNLKVLVVYESHIIHIHPTVFDGLKSLNTFLFNSVPCINEGAYGSENIRALIELTKDKCANPKFMNLILQSKA